MSDKQKVSAEQVDKLKQLEQKTKSEEIKQSIKTKLETINQPINK